MQKLLFALNFLLITNMAFSGQISLGEEKIYPLEFSKSYIAYDINLKKTVHGLNGGDIAGKITPFPLNYQLAFELGLARFLNAGAILESDQVSNPSRGGSSLGSLSLFIKPHIKINNRLAVFIKARGGISYSVGKELYANEEIGSKIFPLYGTSNYFEFGFGPALGASIGIDFFPLSRIGLFLEWGIKSHFANFRKKYYSIPGVERNSEKDIGPKLMSYVINSFPLTLGVYFIF